MDRLQLDPAAIAQYGTAADTVTDALSSAAATASGAADAEQLTADLGLVGAEFTKAFVAAASGNAEALSRAAAVVAGHSRALRTFSAAMTGVDEGTAATLDSATRELA